MKFVFVVVAVVVVVVVVLSLFVLSSSSSSQKKKNLSYNMNAQFYQLAYDDVLPSQLRDDEEGYLYD